MVRSNVTDGDAETCERADFEHVATVTFLASIQTNAKHNSDWLVCAAPLCGSPGAPETGDVNGH